MHLAQNVPVSPVEETTRKFVEELKRRSYVVCGLTSREVNTWYNTPHNGIDKLTIQQLQLIGIDFDTSLLQADYPKLFADSEQSGGIFFENLGSKGEYLKHLFSDQSKKPRLALIIDDKKEQGIGFARAANELNISHKCYHYTATDHFEPFNPLIANIQLYYFLASKTILSSEDANDIAAQHPNRDEKYYLNEALKLGEAHLILSLRDKKHP